MKKNIIILFVSVMLISTLTSCLKKIDLLNTNTISVTFNDAGPKFLTTDRTVNPKDSIQFSYTVTCPNNMKYISIVKNALTGNVVIDTIKPNANHRTYSAVKKMVADSIPGSYYFKVVARDSAGVYMGASTPIIVTVTSNFNYFTNKQLFVPDTTAQTNKTYFNFANETTFSYKDILANNNSNQIDIGYYFDTDSVKIGSTNFAKGHTIYNLNVTPVPSMISMYNTSTFTKNLTYIKRITTPTWVNINSGGIIRSTGIATFRTPPTTNSINLNINDAKSAVATPGGTVIMFKTAAGKYGAMLITYVNQDKPYRNTYMNFEVKMEK